MSAVPKPVLCCGQGEVQRVSDQTVLPQRVWIVANAVSSQQYSIHVVTEHSGGIILTVND